MTLKYILPGFYLFHSRIKRKSEILSLLYVYPIFLFLYMFLWGDFTFWNYVVTFLIGLFVWLSFYEIGYFENDVITTKNEVNPTLRISEEENVWIEKNFFKIISGRILMGCIGTLLLFTIAKYFNFHVDIPFFIIAVIVARVAFYFHNKVRSRWNIMTYFFLSSSKYLSLPLLFYPNLPHFSLLLFSVLLIFPIPRTLEHAAKIKYNVKPLAKFIANLDLFRIKYYSLLATFFGLLYWLTTNIYSLYILSGVCWFLMFRLFIYLLTRLGSYKRTEFKSHRWK